MSVLIVEIFYGNNVYSLVSLLHSNRANIITWAALLEIVKHPQSLPLQMAERLLELS